MGMIEGAKCFLISVCREGGGVCLEELLDISILCSVNFAPYST